tara:strand:- start:365 stop:550 length:186 start_codon:yes stop_codon:yes gene_type:complete
MKVGDLVKMRWGYSPVGIVKKVAPHSVDGHIVDVDPPQMAVIVWADSNKTNERLKDLKVIT